MGLKAAWDALLERKESHARRLISIQKLGQPVFTDRRYDRLADEAYRKNVIAKQAIQQIARGVGGVPWLLSRKRGTRTRVEIEDHELLTLLQRPNPLQGQCAFFEMVVAFFLIAGNSYIEAVGPISGPNTGRPMELWPLRPDRMKVIAGAGGMPAGWEYSVNQEKVTLQVDRGKAPVLHLKSFNPLNDWYGMSSIEAAAYAVDQHNEAGKWNMALLQNMATPSGALVVQVTDQRPAGDLTDDQYERLKREIDERYSGALNAGRPLLLEGGLDWKQMGFTPKDMDWLKGKDSSARDVAIAFGYPPLLLNIPGDNTYANYQEARLGLWEETNIPLLNFIRDELNNWLVPAFDEDLELDYDTDQIDALAIKRAATWDRVGKSTFLSVNEKRDALGYEPVTGGEAVLVPAGMVPLDLAVGEDIEEE